MRNFSKSLFDVCCIQEQNLEQGSFVNYVTKSLISFQNREIEDIHPSVAQIRVDELPFSNSGSLDIHCS
jgi:hypothetical protein